MTATNLLRGNGLRANPTSLTTNIAGRDITISAEMVGPGEAGQFLARNTRNRNKKKASVLQMVDDLTNGDWKFNGSTICIGSDGVLQDGQNRCEAIIAAGVVVPVIVVRGLDPIAQDDMDTGAKRTFGDVLTIRGEKHAHNLAALTRRVGAWEAGARRNIVQWTASHSALSRILDSHPELRDLVLPANRISSAVGIPASNIGMLLWVFHRIDSDDAEFFAERLRDGQGLTKGDPIFELRRTLSDSRSMPGGNAKAMRDVAYVIKAWNAYRAGQTVSHFRWRAGGANPETFPEPQ